MRRRLLLMGCADHDHEHDHECKAPAADSQGVVTDEGKLGWADRLLGKLVSRKLLVFSTATALLALSELDAETWGLIAVIYVGGQSVIDAVKTYKYGE